VHPVAAANRAAGNVDAGQVFEQVLPVRRRVVLVAGAVIRGIGGLQQPSGDEKFGLDVAGGEQAVMSDLAEVLGEDMEQEAPGELMGVQGGRFSVAGGEGNGLVGDRQ